MSMFSPRGVAEASLNRYLETNLVDTPTVLVADPLHPGGFDFSVDLHQPPATDAGVAAFARDRASSAPDPFDLVAGEIDSLSDGIRSLLGSDHPVLEVCARYFFELDGGKKIRPTMVLLMSHAVAASASAGDVTPGVLPSQRRLAEITEMIHTASLFHDDVIDKADTRRGVPSVNRAFGNKLAILGGDFLLARASMSLARLRNVEVVELLSTVIEHLVKGEVMQMRGGHLKDVTALEYYFHKNYYKTGSLMANSCKAAVILSADRANTDPAVIAAQAEAAFSYGKHVGLAFQLIDDVLDMEGSVQSLGKPALADLGAGLATAPVLLAAEEYPRLQVLIERKFKEPGDVDETLRLVARSQGMTRAKDLATAQADKALEAILTMEPSSARDALAHLAYKVVTRNH